MKSLYVILIAMILISGRPLYAQFSITNDGSSADPSAMLDVKSTNRGALLPRMTQAQIGAILNPANGLIVFCTTDNKFYAFIANANTWKEILYGTGTINPPFACGNALVDSRDGQSYPTVGIGTQCWMAQNLNIGTRINGSGAQTNNNTLEKYCYNDDEANCNIYGGLYQWFEMVQYQNTSQQPVQGICPTGWHIPTVLEWETLTTLLGGTSMAGGKMKSTGTLESGTGLWYSPNTGATNESGFTAVPAGSHGYTFEDLGSACRWWSLTAGFTLGPWAPELHYNVGNVFYYGQVEDCGFSVRCLRDF
jgi:uncharacterized protein (TIGR02145 family)